MQKQKLIFLDIDGVMNNKKDGTSYFCLNPNSYGISNENLNNLDKLLKNTNAKIVLITSWRKHPLDSIYMYNNMKFKSPLGKLLNFIQSKNGFFSTDGKEVSSCPHIRGCSKRDDILGFFYNQQIINNTDMSDYNFVILDDAKNQDLHRFGRRFFYTNVETGLTKSDVEELTLYLNYEE